MSLQATSPGPASCLAALAADRDPAAWAVLLADLGERIRRCCARIAGPHLADDAVQETLLHLRDDAGRFRVPPGGDPDAAAQAWILAVATNSALQVRRRERRLQHREHRVAAEAAMHHDPDPAAGLLQAERAAEVRQALAMLPPAMRTAVALRHIEGLGSSEIAAVLVCPEGTAKALVHRGLERLRRLLGARGVALGLAGLASLLADLPAAEHAGSASLAAGPGMLDSALRPSTQALPMRPSHPDRLLRYALLLGLAATICLAWLLPRSTGGRAEAETPVVRQTAAPSAHATEAEAEEALRRLIGLSDLPAAGGAGATSTAGGATATTARSGITTSLTDETGRTTQYRLEQRGNGPWLEARRDGALLWSGPVGSAAERAVVPEELILGATGLGLDFNVQHLDKPGEQVLILRTGGQNAAPASPQ